MIEAQNCEHGESGACFDCIVGGSNPAPVAHTVTVKPVMRPRIVNKAQGYGFAQSFSKRVQDARDSGQDYEDYVLSGNARRDARAEELAERAEAYNAITDKQASFLASLIASKGSDLHQSIDVATLTKWQASRLIDELVKMPIVVAVAPAKSEVLPNVPEGRYAVTGQNGQTAFYRVSRYNGFLTLKVQASDTLLPITGYAARLTVLNQIMAQGIRESLIRYGKELGRCGVCGKTLTDEASRALGIGPICIDKGF